MRFGVYGDRLTSALREGSRRRHGLRHRSLESYHTVWFQLHEDLLVTLGISREDEEALSRGRRNRPKTPATRSADEKTEPMGRRGPARSRNDR